MKPIIGITISYSEQTVELKHAYYEAIFRAGGMPISIPFTENEADIEQICGFIHGLLLTGGPDVFPAYYGEEPSTRLGGISPRRDRLEMAYTKRCLQLNLPIFAICRGHQVLNVAAGGDLYQDIPSQCGGELQHKQNAPRDFITHRVQAVEGSLLHRVAETEDFRVNSFHHQAVRNVAPGFKATGLALDGIVESIESEAHEFVLGVQWHPEDTAFTDEISARLFEAFVTACKV